MAKTARVFITVDLKLMDNEQSSKAGQHRQDITEAFLDEVRNIEVWIGDDGYEVERVEQT